MFVFDVQGIRVRYADTDQMGYVYYGNYARYYEIGRVEALRSLGISYRDLEESGVLMPVIESKSRYLAPGRYDDLLTIRVIIAQMPGARIVFEYEITNQDGTLLNKGETTLVFQKKENLRLCPLPPLLKEKLQQYYN